MKSEERYLIALGNLQSMAIDNTKGSRAVEICVNDIQNYVKLKDNIIKKVRELIEEDYFEDGSFENYYKVMSLLKGEE